MISTTDEVFLLPPEEGPEAYYGAGFLDEVRDRRRAGASVIELVDLLCSADLRPILDDPKRHVPYYVNLLTADAQSARAVSEGARVYDRYNERLLQEILTDTPLSGNEDAQRLLRIAFAMNSHGTLIEALKGEDPGLLLEASRLLRRAVLELLLTDGQNGNV